MPGSPRKRRAARRAPRPQLVSRKACSAPATRPTRPTPISSRASSTRPCACSERPHERAPIRSRAGSRPFRRQRSRDLGEGGGTMSISSLLNIGSGAMAASDTHLTVTGNNIANANTPGYSQQTANLETSFSQQTGSGFFGSGVDVATVTRAHSDFLTREAAVSASIAAADDTRSTQLQQLQGVFQTDTSGLGYAAQQAFNSFVAVANNPQDASARQAALASVGNMASDFSNASSQIDSRQAGVADQFRPSGASINS